MEVSKKAGADRIFVGVESGCEAQLKRYNKGTTPIQNIIAIRILTALGIRVRLGFVIFDPLMPAMEELQQNIQFLDRTDVILKQVPQEYTNEELLIKVESDKQFINVYKENIGLYNCVSYLMTGLEVFVNAPYAKMVQSYERDNMTSLIYGYDWEMGKLQVHYINQQIENVYNICNLWVKKNYKVSYTLKSLLKSADESQKKILKTQLYKYRQFIFNFAKEIINVTKNYRTESDNNENITDNILKEQNECMSNIYLNWMQNSIKPYIEDLSKMVEKDIINDTENQIFAIALKEWLENSSEISDLSLLIK